MRYVDNSFGAIGIRAFHDHIPPEQQGYMKCGGFYLDFYSAQNSFYNTVGAVLTESQAAAVLGIRVESLRKRRMNGSAPEHILYSHHHVHYKVASVAALAIEMHKRRPKGHKQ